jgi:peptidoglycan/LPS O-acetylase OafA/YrhL
VKPLHPNEKEVFYTLDAMRGVAAICVMFYHFNAWLSPKPLLPSSYLAVDLFFLLSGFVIAHAYNGRLGGGMTLLTFVRIRLIRLFPVYLIGTGLGLAYFLLRMRLEPGKPIGLVYLGRETLLSVLMLPQIGKATLPGLYPFDPAAWSLFLEVLANIAYAAVFRLITTRRLMIFVAASGVLLAWI